MTLPQAESPPDIDDPPSRAVDHRPSCAHSKLEDDWPHHPVSFSQIRSSAASCRICHLYMDIILAVVKGSLPSIFQGPRNDAEKTMILERLNLIYETNMLKDLCFNILDNNIDIDIFRDGDDDKCRDFTVQGRRFRQGFRIGPCTNSEESFGKARKWLRECLTSHNCLAPSSTSIQLPKRLLDVRGSAKDPIQLVDTQGDEYPYACLSHRWGSPEHKRLISTTQTIQDHRAKIAWNDLPATFQDAVTICRNMAVSYCWIDSLCILQSDDGLTDDELEATRLDFAQENSVMAKIYYNSHFTISADISTHMDSGIFSKSRTHDHWVEAIDDADESAKIYFRKTTNHFRERIPDIETRGWTFQEFSLPRRVLHFGPFDIEWRCANRLTCECSQLDCELIPQSSWHRHHFLAEVAEPVPHDSPSALRWWESVVHHYTERKLTDPSDKLPALSGLAQLRKESRSGMYLAGLWQDSLIHDLCWYHTLNYNVATSGGPGRRPVDYRAPSWSWASLDTDSPCSFWWTGRISIHPIFPWAEPRQVCTIFEAFCRPKTADITGEVQCGFLDIGVVLIPATVCLDSRKEVAWTITNIETDLQLDFFKPDCELENDGLSLGAQVYCAPIAEAVVDTGLQRGCLVLRKLYTSLYQRVGFCILQKGEREEPYIQRAFSFGSDDQVEEYPSPPKLNYQDYTFLDADKSRIMII